MREPGPPRRLLRRQCGRCGARNLNASRCLINGEPIAVYTCAGCGKVIDPTDPLGGGGLYAPPPEIDFADNLTGKLVAAVPDEPELGAWN